MTKELVENFVNHAFRISDVLNLPEVRESRIQEFDNFCNDNEIKKGCPNYDVLHEVYFSCGNYYCAMKDGQQDTLNSFIKQNESIIDNYINRFGLTVDDLYRKFVGNK